MRSPGIRGARPLTGCQLELGTTTVVSSGSCWATRNLSRLASAIYGYCAQCWCSRPAHRERKPKTPGVWYGAVRKSGVAGMGMGPSLRLYDVFEARTSFIVNSWISKSVADLSVIRLTVVHRYPFAVKDSVGFQDRICVKSLW